MTQSLQPMAEVEPIATGELQAGRLSIAAYGFVAADAGSVASASFLIMKRMLDLGHRIDFYAIDGFIRCPPLEQYANFSFIPVNLPKVVRVWRFLEAHVPGFARQATFVAFSQISNNLFHRAIGRTISKASTTRQYDALLVLGVLCPFDVKGMPRISWPQGAPNGEWDAIWRLKRQIIRLSGIGLFLMLSIFYFYRRLSFRRIVNRSEVIVCGSQWSCGNWERMGKKRDAIFAVPYPIDLELFQPAIAENRRDVVTFLWLGRIVPRKRFDLLLQAFKLLHTERNNVRLLIIGKFDYGGGYQKLLDGLKPEDGIEYRPFIERKNVPALLHDIDVMVQPSENEDIGSSVLEALACGKMVIVGPSNGTRDYLSPSSITFSEYTAESLKDAMSRAIEALQNDPQKIAREARETAAKNLPLATVVDKLCAIIKGAKPANSQTMPRA